jgi:hypothetical protein
VAEGVGVAEGGAGGGVEGPQPESKALTESKREPISSFFILL